MLEFVIFSTVVIFFLGTIATMLIIAKKSKGSVDHLRLLGEQMGVSVVGAASRFLKRSNGFLF